jgi:hypothetical protein
VRTERQEHSQLSAANRQNSCIISALLLLAGIKRNLNFKEFLARMRRTKVLGLFLSFVSLAGVASGPDHYKSSN